MSSGTSYKDLNRDGRNFLCLASIFKMRRCQCGSMREELLRALFIKKDRILIDAIALYANKPDRNTFGINSPPLHANSLKPKIDLFFVLNG